MYNDIQYKKKKLHFLPTHIHLCEGELYKCNAKTFNSVCVEERPDDSGKHHQF